MADLFRYPAGVVMALLALAPLFFKLASPDYIVNEAVTVVHECRLTLDGNGTTIVLAPGNRPGIEIGGNGWDGRSACYLQLHHFIIDGRNATELTGVRVRDRTFEEARGGERG